MTSYLRKWINTPALIVALFTGTMATAQDQKNAFSAQEAVEYPFKKYCAGEECNAGTAN